MSKRDICLKIIIWFQNRDMMKRKKFRMLFFCKRKKKLNRPKWSNNKMSKERDKIYSESNKKIKWKIKLVSNRRDSPKWKSRRKEEENRQMLKENTRWDAPKKRDFETWKWMRYNKWRNLKWNSLRDCRILKPYRKKHISSLKKHWDNHLPCWIQTPLSKI